MATFTPNYGLHQWESSDAFLRTEFNQDFSILDTALGQVARTGVDSAYNLYNLMLQSQYEGKYTGYKRALLFDGFPDESAIAEKDAALVVRDHGLRLFRTGEAAWTAAKGSSYGAPYYGSIYTQERTAVGAGLLTGFQATIRNPSAEEMTLEVWHNGEKVRQEHAAEENEGEEDHADHGDLVPDKGTDDHLQRALQNLFFLLRETAQNHPLGRCCRRGASGFLLVVTHRLPSFSFPVSRGGPPAYRRCP